jgi:hypothetical protein
LKDFLRSTAEEILGTDAASMCKLFLRGYAVRVISGSPIFPLSNPCLLNKAQLSGDPMSLNAMLEHQLHLLQLFLSLTNSKKAHYYLIDY